MYWESSPPSSRLAARSLSLTFSTSFLHWPFSATVYLQVNSVWMLPTLLVRDILSPALLTGLVWKLMAQKQ